MNRTTDRTNLSGVIKLKSLHDIAVATVLTLNFTNQDQHESTYGESRYQKNLESSNFERNCSSRAEPCQKSRWYSDTQLVMTGTAAASRICQTLGFGTLGRNPLQPGRPDDPRPVAVPFAQGFRAAVIHSEQVLVVKDSDDC